MRLIKGLLLSLILLTTISACEVSTEKSDEKSDEKNFLAAGIYDLKTSEAELLYLSSLDTEKLTEVEREGVKVRIEELGKIGELLKDNANIININRCYPLPRNPPAPCPVGGDLLTSLPAGTRIDLDLFGVYLDIPEKPEARISEESSSMQLTTEDGKDVFAIGTLNTYDKLFRTAWYHFDVENPKLAEQSLILKIQTVIILKEEVQQIVMEVPVPKGTFLVE
jgi:hypothetical protein